MKLRNILFASVTALLPMLPIAAYADEPNDDPFELSIDENLTPGKMGKKQVEAVRQRMQTVASELKRHNLPVVKSHDGLVLTVSIPCAKLFAANDTTAMLPDADAVLRQFLPYVEKTDLYRIVISVHSDNTGSEQYQYDVTDARANLVSDFFEKLVPEAASNIIPYGLGHEERLLPDNSIANRSKNRRVEINIVPIK